MRALVVEERGELGVGRGRADERLLTQDLGVDVVAAEARRGRFGREERLSHATDALASPRARELDARREQREVEGARGEPGADRRRRELQAAVAEPRVRARDER